MSCHCIFETVLRKSVCHRRGHREIELGEEKLFFETVFE